MPGAALAVDDGAARVARPDRNLALELVRVTEYAALAAARVGLGDKEAADQAAVDAMRQMLESVRMDGRVVIGEGEKDEAPMLYNGERIGDGSPPRWTSRSIRSRARSSPPRRAASAGDHRARRAGLDVRPRAVYMEKMAASARYAGLLDLDRPLGETLRLIAREKGTNVRDVSVVMLDRPRHEDAVRKSARRAGGSASSRTATCRRRSSP